MKIKSFCPLFSKSGQGQGAAAPCGIFKGEALKLPIKIQNLRKQILTVTIGFSTAQLEMFFEICQTVKQQYIVTYLGISPESLSHIRIMAFSYLLASKKLNISIQCRVRKLCIFLFLFAKDFQSQR